MADWTLLILEAGLDPTEVEVRVTRPFLRRQQSAIATHAGSGVASQHSGAGSAESNVREALSGLRDLLSGGATSE